VCGLDRLGKSTLIKNIKHKLGYFQVIHFSKPERLQAYQGAQAYDDNYSLIKNADLLAYQNASFINSMLLVKSGARIIFDRWHLGEAVYSPLYRGYSGDYVFELEKQFSLDSNHAIRLILLTEDFASSKHFVDDGDSFDPGQRKKEQELFIKAFDRSIINDKRIVCVTDTATGNFRPEADILTNALE
jgi:thymidylate kinase